MEEYSTLVKLEKSKFSNFINYFIPNGIDLLKTPKEVIKKQMGHLFNQRNNWKF